MREIQGYKSGHGQLEGWIQNVHEKLQFFKAIPIRSLVKYVCVCVVCCGPMQRNRYIFRPVGFIYGAVVLTLYQRPLTLSHGPQWSR